MEVAPEEIPSNSNFGWAIFDFGWNPSQPHFPEIDKKDSGTDGVVSELHFVLLHDPFETHYS